jgi:hypothetical protein
LSLGVPFKAAADRGVGRVFQVAALLPAEVQLLLLSSGGMLFMCLATKTRDE